MSQSGKPVETDTASASERQISGPVICLRSADVAPRRHPRVRLVQKSVPARQPCLCFSDFPVQRTTQQRLSFTALAAKTGRQFGRGDANFI